MIVAGPQKFTVDSARQITFKATAPARTTEEHLYADCTKKVRQEASQGHLHATITMPTFIFGLPLYNTRLMRDKLALRFEREGWTVNVHGDRQLTLGWGQGAKNKMGPERKSAPAPKRNGKTARIRR